MVLRDVIKGTTHSYHVHTRTAEDIEMVNRCVAADCSNMHSDRVSLFKLRYLETAVRRPSPANPSAMESHRSVVPPFYRRLL